MHSAVFGLVVTLDFIYIPDSPTILNAPYGFYTDRGEANKYNRSLSLTLDTLRLPLYLPHLLPLLTPSFGCEYLRTEHPAIFFS